MHIGQSIVGIFLATLLCACGGGDAVDTTGRLGPLVAPGAVSTVAGTGVAAYTDGKVTRVSSPSALAVDIHGTVYIADTGNHSIRKLATDGTMSTLAGHIVVDAEGVSKPVAGYADGQGTAASFNLPEGIALDAKGNVYVADTGNHRIRMITPGGEVSTLAGNGTAGFGDDANSPMAAMFNEPRGIAVESNGSAIYVADFNNHVVRKITADGVATLAGSAGLAGSANGNSTAARFRFPLGLALSGSGSLYVTDYGDHWESNNKIRRIAVSSGVVSTFAGQGQAGMLDGTAFEAQFSRPAGVAVRFVDGDDVVYVADTGNHSIRKIVSTGDVSTVAGSGMPGGEDVNGNMASFTTSRGIALDRLGNIYVADTDNQLIRKIAK